MVDINKILILTSGKVAKLSSFDLPFKASFDDVNYSSGVEDIFVGDKNLKDFEVIYFRMVGKSLEPATLIANYAVKNGIKIVDRIYEKSLLMPLSLGKGIELKLLSEGGIPIPETVFGRFDKLPFPFIVKSTSSQKGREVWKVENKDELEKLPRQEGKFYFAQEFIPDARRIRVLVVGKKAVGAILRETKWNKDGTKITLNPIPEEVENLALLATDTAGLDICGVDILVNGENKMWVIEANAAPSWNLIKKYCEVNVENEIIKYIQGQV